MRILFLVPLLFVLTGCLSTPVKRNFPEVPQELMEVCPDLKETEPTEKLSDVLTVINNNYTQYHECKIKTDTWIEWYKTQKQIFDSVK